jgi:hypothetical protein
MVQGEVSMTINDDIMSSQHAVTVRRQVQEVRAHCNAGQFGRCDTGAVENKYV